MLAALVEEVEKRYRTSFFVSGVAHSLAKEAHEENELHLQRVGVFDMSCSNTLCFTPTAFTNLRNGHSPAFTRHYVSHRRTLGS
jgi:hypothetical protein